VAYQKALIQQISAQTSLNVKGIKPISDKVSRFAPLEGRYEMGQVIHARSLDPAFENELLGFPIGSHDDMCDSLAYAWQALDELQTASAGWGTSRLKGKREAQ
jgi:predicted phage terminase large subunit-like protein